MRSSRAEAAVSSHQTVRLEAGSHPFPEHGVCAMELASMLAGEAFSDQPSSVCPVIGAVLRAYNDLAGDRLRQDLYPYASAVVGSRACREVENLRLERCLAWADQRRSEGRRPVLARRPPSDRRRRFVRSVLPLLRRPDGRRHQQVLALLDGLLAADGPSCGQQQPVGSSSHSARA